MCTTTCCLTHKRGAFQHLQVIAELLCAGISPGGSQQVYRLVGQSVCWNRRVSPGLLRRIFPRVGPVLWMVDGGGGHQSNHGWLAATVVPQIEDNRVRMIQRSHRSRSSLLAYRNIRK